VFTNLIDNARSFSPPGGEVRVTARRDGDDIEIVVEDDGTRHPRRRDERIFERFYTDRPESRASATIPASACRSPSRSSRPMAAEHHRREPARYPMRPGSPILRRVRSRSPRSGLRGFRSHRGATLSRNFWGFCSLARHCEALCRGEALQAAAPLAKCLWLS
jgi:hypothetical protein